MNNKTNDTTIAICYDFDKTLTTKFGQEFGFYDAIDYSNEEFWEEVLKTSKEYEAEALLVAMYVAIDKFKETGKPLTRQKLFQFGKKVEFYKGVEEWFSHISNYGKKLGLNIEHYIISANYKTLIEGTKIAHNFKKIYGCEFMYNQKDEAHLVANIIEPATKSVCLNRISKQVLNFGDEAVFDFKKEEEKIIECKNMFYLGDSYFDLPALLALNKNGGTAIAVYNENEKGLNQNEEIVKYKNDNQIKAYLPADYSVGSPLASFIEDKLQEIKAEIDGK